MRFEHDHYSRLWSVASRRGRSGFARVWKVKQVKDSSRFKQLVRCCDRRALTFEMALLEVNMIFALEALRFLVEKELLLFNQIVPVGMRSLSMAAKRKAIFAFETFKLSKKKIKKKKKSLHLSSGDWLFCDHHESFKSRFNKYI